VKVSSLTHSSLLLLSSHFASKLELSYEDGVHIFLMLTDVMCSSKKLQLPNVEPLDEGHIQA